MNPVYLIAAGGVTLFLLLSFQVLVGLRKITFKGPLHMKVHRYAAYVLLAFAAFHGILAAGILIFAWF
jgi:hypothetical protein